MGDWRQEHGRGDPLAWWVADAGEPMPVHAGGLVDPRTLTTLCLLTDGWMVRTREVGQGRTAILAIYLPGDIVMLDVWSGAPAGDRLLALTACDVMCRSLEELETALDLQPAVARSVIRRLGQESGLLRVALAAVGRLDAQDRVLVFLHQAHQRLVASGMLAASAHRFPCPLTQAQLANALGITSVHVNRVLSTLRRSDILKVAHGQVEVQDWAAFEGPALAIA